MKEELKKVEEFNTKFRAGVQKKPTLISEDLYNLRYELMKEENEEYLAACKDNDLTEVADALGDKLYILLGTIINHGMQDIIVDIFNEIHESNMSKLDDNGEPLINGENAIDSTRPYGKVLKSKNFKKPNINSILYKKI